MIGSLFERVEAKLTIGDVMVVVVVVVVSFCNVPQTFYSCKCLRIFIFIAYLQATLSSWHSALSNLVSFPPLEF